MSIKAIITIEGGLIQDIAIDSEQILDIIVIDRDTDGADEEDIVETGSHGQHGTTAMLSSWLVDGTQETPETIKEIHHMHELWEKKYKDQTTPVG